MHIGPCMPAMACCFVVGIGNGCIDEELAFDCIGAGLGILDLVPWKFEVVASSGVIVYFQFVQEVAFGCTEVLLGFSCPWSLTSEIVALIEMFVCLQFAQAGSFVLSEGWPYDELQVVSQLMIALFVQIVPFVWRPFLGLAT